MCSRREKSSYRLPGGTCGRSAPLTSISRGEIRCPRGRSCLGGGLLGESHGRIASGRQGSGFPVSHGGICSKTRFQPVRFGRSVDQPKHMRRKRSHRARIDWYMVNLTIVQVARMGASHASWASMSLFGRVCPPSLQWIPSAFCDDFLASVRPWQLSELRRPS